MSNSIKWCYVKLILAIFIWALNYHAVKEMVMVTDVYLVGFLRYLIAGVLLILILKATTGKIIHTLSCREFIYIALVGLTGVVIYNILFFKAEQLLSASTVALFFAFTPTISTLISAKVFKTKLNRLSIIGICLALVGAIGVINYSTPSCQKFFCLNSLTSMGYGELLAILATFAFASYSVFNKLATQSGVSNIVVNTYAAIIGLIAFAVMAMIKSDFYTITSFGAKFYWAILFVGVFSTVVAYLWYTEAIIRLGVFKTVVFQNTITLQAVLIGVIFYGEVLSFGELFCGMIIITGVYITNTAISKK